MDSDVFFNVAINEPDEETAKRYYRAAVFSGFTAVESFINIVAEAFRIAGTLEQFELAFLNDKKYELKKGVFSISEKAEYHRIDDKLRFLFAKFVKKFDFENESDWSRFFEFKNFRDSIMHPRTDSDEISPKEYKRRIKLGMVSCIGLLNRLRKRLLELFQ